MLTTVLHCYAILYIHKSSDTGSLRQHWYLEHTFTGTAVWPASIEAQFATGQDIQGRGWRGRTK